MPKKAETVDNTSKNEGREHTYVPWQTWHRVFVQDFVDMLSNNVMSFQIVSVWDKRPVAESVEDVWLVG